MPSAFDRAVLAILPHVPTPLMRRLASRYIAGESLDEALTKLQSLAAEGYSGIIDLLGEDVQGTAAVREVAASYTAIASAVAHSKLDCYVSVKPTHVGLKQSEDLCFELYSALAAHCAQLGLFLRVEMEDHPTVDGTLRVFERLRQAHANVGLVLQARLFRTPGDIARLAPGPLHVRMVKGIYLEPASIAHTEPAPIRAAYLQCVRLLFERGASVSFATHDDLLADDLLRLVLELEVERTRYEFQLLLGVREWLWKRWREAGHPVRIYVPYGPDWKPYSLRRLRKNPQILRHVIKDSLGLGKRG